MAFESLIDSIELDAEDFRRGMVAATERIQDEEVEE